MAGMGEALASMFAGAAGEYAGNRANEIREEDKARITNAREMKMMQLQQRYQTGEREATQKFKTGEREATQAFESDQSEKQRQHAASMQANQQSFTAGQNAMDRAQRDAIAKAKSDGTGPNGKKLKGTPMLEKGDEISGKPSRLIYNYEDGSSQVVNVEDLPGGENYAANEVKPKAMEFGQDVADMRRGAPEEVKAKDKAQTKAEPAEVKAKPAESGYTPTQQQMIDGYKAKYPGASEEQIVSAIKKNPQAASLFK